MEWSILFIEIIILCFLFFIICILGTGTDKKNLKNYSSYPDEIQVRIKNLKEYDGRFKEKSKISTFIGNFLFFLVLFLIFGIFIRQENFIHNFLFIFILGQALNLFDLIVIDLLWWRNSKRIRFSKVPERALYMDPKKHIDSFLRALIMYFMVGIVDGYLLTLF